MPGGEEKEAPAAPEPAPESAAPAPEPVDPIEERTELELVMEIHPVMEDRTNYGEEESAIVPSSAMNLSKFYTTKGIVKGIEKAVEMSDKMGTDTAEIYSGKPFCFNRGIVKSIQDGKKTVVYYFKHDGHLYKVVIPPTVEAEMILESEGHAGPLYVGQQLGSTYVLE